MPIIANWELTFGYFFLLFSIKQSVFLSLGTFLLAIRPCFQPLNLLVIVRIEIEDGEGSFLTRDEKVSSCLVSKA